MSEQNVTNTFITPRILMDYAAVLVVYDGKQIYIRNGTDLNYIVDCMYDAIDHKPVIPTENEVGRDVHWGSFGFIKHKVICLDENKYSLIITKCSRRETDNPLTTVRTFTSLKDVVKNISSDFYEKCYTIQSDKVFTTGAELSDYLSEGNGKPVA